MGGTAPHGAPYPTGTDRVADGDNAIQALANWVDLRTAVAPSGPATAALAFKYYTPTVSFGGSGEGRYDWSPIKPNGIVAVWICHNGQATNNDLRLWNGVNPNGFDNNSVWLIGGPPNGAIGLVLFLVLDRVA